MDLAEKEARKARLREYTAADVVLARWMHSMQCSTPPAGPAQRTSTVPMCLCTACIFCAELAPSSASLALSSCSSSSPSRPHSVSTASASSPAGTAGKSGTALRCLAALSYAAHPSTSPSYTGAKAVPTVVLLCTHLEAPPRMPSSSAWPAPSAAPSSPPGAACGPPARLPPPQPARTALIFTFNKREWTAHSELACVCVHARVCARARECV